ncbi:MAG: hypothetical protein ABIN89_24420 [Chitinophagaceae bacterium]
MKNSNFPSVNGMHPLLFCAGMFLVAAFFTVLVCFTSFYAFHSMNSDAGVSKSHNAAETTMVKSMYASVK